MLKCDLMRPLSQQRCTDATTSGQVTELQKFLVDYYDLDPTLYISGYFGRLTQSNVVRFQQEQNLPAFGYVGPLTRAAITRVCGDRTTSVNFSATPTSGPAPIAVTFSLVGSANRPVPMNGMVRLDFGDGSSVDKTYVRTFCDSEVQQPSGQWLCRVTHTYGTSGTYTSKLIQYPELYPCDSAPQTNCPQQPEPTILGTVTITVRGTSVPPTPVSCVPREAFAPVCGHYPGRCMGGMYGADCSAPADRTYLNQCELQNTGATLLHSGTCTGQSLQPLVILTPHGGETFAPGSPITISWQSPRPDSGTTHINLSLGSIPQPSPPCTTTTTGNISTTCTAVGGSIQLIPGIITGTSYTWTIPQSYVNQPGQYRITLGWSDTDIDMTAYSNAFTIQ